MDIARLELLGLRLVLILGMAFATYVGLRMYGHARYQAGVDAQKGIYQAQYLAEVQKVRQEEADKRTAVEKAHEQDVVRAQGAAVALAGVSDELGRLRSALARRGAASADPAARTGADDPAMLRRLFGACAEEYLSVARDGRSDADKVIGLQNYVRAAGLKSDGHSPAEGGGQRAVFGSFAATQPSAPSKEGAQQ